MVGESTAHAQEREQTFLNDLVDPMASLTLLSELMNHDFSGLDLDAPITDELIETVSGVRGLVQNLRRHIGGDHPGSPGIETSSKSSSSSKVAPASRRLSRGRPARAPSRSETGTAAL